MRLIDADLLGLTDMEIVMCDGDYKEALKMLIDKIEHATTIEPEQWWIPTSEKLPEYDKPVLLSTAWGKTEIGFWTQRGWMVVACSYREFEQDAVTAWMPLPEPYAERRQDALN